MPYVHLIAAVVMTLGVCQGHSSIASFFSILISASRGTSAIAELASFLLHQMFNVSTSLVDVALKPAIQANIMIS